jgi:hypothetical protein
MRNWDMPAIVRSQSTEEGEMAGEAAARYRRDGTTITTPSMICSTSSAP